MKPIDYILIGGLAAVLVGIVVGLIKRKKEGKNGCGCGCSSCPSAGNCPSVQKEKEDD